MKRRAFIQVGIGLGVEASAKAYEKLHWQTSLFIGLGTTLSIRAAHKDKLKLINALAAARAVVAHIEDEMSLFKQSSSLCKLNREGELSQPNADLLHVLRISQNISSLSHGAFDFTVQPLWNAYSCAKGLGTLPSALEIDLARQKVGWQHVQISTKRIAFAKPGMGITLNGIAQGYAADCVRKELQRFGVMHALINTGEWASLGSADEGRNWMLGIADPHHAKGVLARLPLNDFCVATSADDQCSFTNDHKHHHIFDPATGYSPSDISSVSIIARSCTLADALTKVIFVGGYDKALHLAQSWKVEALVVHKNGQWKSTPKLAKQLLV